MNNNQFFVFALILVNIGCEMSTTPNLSEISEYQRIISGFDKFYSGDSLHLQLPIEDSSAFLDFKLGMPLKEFENHRNKLAKEGKIRLDNDGGGFTFTLTQDEPQLLGSHDNYYSPDRGFDYYFVFKPDELVQTDLKNIYKSIEDDKKDTITIKKVENHFTECQQKILKIFVEKYSNDYVRSGNTYKWYFGGKKIELFFYEPKTIYTDFYPAESEDNIILGTAEYVDLKKFKEYLKNAVIQSEKNKKEEQIKRIKSLNI